MKQGAVSVVGLGKIGLPLAVQFATKGRFVFGIDINAETVTNVNLGEETFPGEEGLSEKLKFVVESKSLVASTETERCVRESSVVVVIVPLYVNASGVPDFSALDSVAELIGKGLQPGTLISFETTVPVGITRNRLTPILERNSGLKAGKDFFVVFSPERVFSGRVFKDLMKYPKLVGGITNTCTSNGVDFYKSVLDFEEQKGLNKANGVWAMSSCEAAEFTKLAETTYRDVNIALANQFALFAENNGLDIHEVIEAANSQSFSHLHKPGIAVGGHCIPIYPQMYLWTDPQASLVAEARRINENMPEETLQVAERIHGPLLGKRVLLLGVSYRGDVKETAFSGAFPTIKGILKRGGIVFVHDPLYSNKELEELDLIPYEMGSRVDIAIIQSDHSEYRNLDLTQFPGLQTVIDGRGIIRRDNSDGIQIHVLGNQKS